MKTTIYYFLQLIIVFLVTSLSGAFAASQGKLGKSSTGSVHISIHVNQTLNTVSPSELILNQSSHSLRENSKPFCIAHNGFKQYSSVPYELIVENLSTARNNSAFPYKLYLEDKNSLDEKLHLKSGMTMPKQSRLSFNKDIQQECADSGVALTIEVSDKHKTNNLQQLDPGLMILMVGPI